MNHTTLKFVFLAILLNTIATYSHGQINPEGTPFPKLSSPIKSNGGATSPQSSQKGMRTGKIDTSVKSVEIPKLLGKHKREIAKWYNIPEEEFDKKCKNDKCVKIDQDGRLFHACAGLALSPEESEKIISQDITDYSLNFNYDIEPDMAFELESMPDAQRTIYLDFDGHITTGTFWNNADRPEITHPAMDLDATPTYFTEHEKKSIIKIWKQVCEDFAPYAVNVTTKAPPLHKLIKSNNTDQEFGIRVVIGGNGRNFLPASYGGIAYVGSFSWANDTPTFAFSDNLGRHPKYIAEVISHEVGHTAGLWHHGTTSGATYYGGDGIWAPIMGVSYGARVGQWSKGEYPLANNKNPDMETMANHMPFKEDVEAKPTHNPILGKPFYGTIHKPNEVDRFLLDLVGGTITIRVELPEYFPNTDLCMNLKDEKGNILSTHKFYPTPYISVNVKKGRHTLELFGAAFAGAGNSSYGSTGEYKLTITQDSAIAHITNANIAQDNDLIVISGLETYPQTSNTTIDYDWEVATYNAPQNFKKIEGSSSQTLNLNSHDLLGKYIRATLTPKTGGKENTSFTTRPFKIVTSPPKIVVAKEFFEFSSSLELSKNTQEQIGIIINELSQGHNFGENPEWIELLTLKETDLRGFSLKTKNPGVLKFKNSPSWSKIPEGTIIIVYNGKEKDPLIGEDRFLPYTERLIIVNSNDTSLFEGTWAKLQAPKNKIALETGFEHSQKTMYTKTTINIDGKNWILDDALIVEDQRDMKEGLKSLRMRNGSIETQDYLTEGIKEISFLYSRANFSGDRTGTSPTFQVYYSKKNDPNKWIAIGAQVSVFNDELQKFNAVVNYDGEYKIKIAKVSGTKDKRWNIDNLKIQESSTMNFIQLVDNQSKIVKELHFGYSDKAIKNGFLLPNITESFSSSEPSEIRDGSKWVANTWAKNTTTITPGKGNSIENQNLILNLSSEFLGNLPTYWLENAPEGLEIDTTTGRVFGSIKTGGFYKIRVNNSNGVTSQHEVLPILVKQSFRDSFSNNPEIANDPEGDHNNNGIPNIVEFALGGNSKIETSVSKLSELSLLVANSGKKLNSSQEDNQFALSITYMRNKVADGIEVIPQWSADLINWGSNQIQSAVLEDLGDKEKVISWIPIPTAPSLEEYTGQAPNGEISPPSHKMFMRLSVTENKKEE
jgi:hypothetical protein